MFSSWKNLFFCNQRFERQFFIANISMLHVYELKYFKSKRVLFKELSVLYILQVPWLSSYFYSLTECERDLCNKQCNLNGLNLLHIFTDVFMS